MRYHQTAWSGAPNSPLTPGSQGELAPTLVIHPWPDPVIDTLGHDPRSAYVEIYWLPVLGPSTTWLLRRLAAMLELSPEGFDLDLADTAHRLGLGHKGGRNSPFMRSLLRCVSFDVAQPRGPGVLAVRRRLPPLNRRQVLRLPQSLQSSHQRWQQAQLHAAPGRDPSSVGLQRRALQLAARQASRPEPSASTERVSGRRTSDGNPGVLA